MWATALALALASGSVAAAPAKKGKASTFDAKATALLLSSTEPERIREGLRAVKQGGKDASPVLPLVVRLLGRGLSSELTKEALGAAGAIGDASSSADVARYSKHRDAEIRRVAVATRLKTNGPVAVSTMREALSDADGRVRGTAASGLGALGAREALPELTTALEKKVIEAAAAIGQLCKDDECEAFAKETTKVPFDVMTSGFDQILFRGDVTDDQKIKIVGRIRELGTGDAHRFLKDVAGRFTGAARVKQALEQAAAATAGSPGAKESKEKEGE